MAGTAQTFIVIYSIFVIVLGVLFSLIFAANNLKIKYGIFAITIIIALSLYQHSVQKTVS